MGFKLGKKKRDVMIYAVVIWFEDNFVYFFCVYDLMEICYLRLGMKFFILYFGLFEILNF